MEEEIKAKIVDYLSKRYGNRLDPTQVPLNGGLMHFLGIDSLASLELLVDMESLFDIQIDDEILSFELVDNIHHMAKTFSKMKALI